MAKTEKESKEMTQAEQRALQRRRAGMAPFEDMDRLFDNFFQRGWLSPFRWELPWPEAAHRPFEGRVPHVDIIDRADEIVLRAELPGVDKKDLEISMTEDSVTINATTRYEAKEEKGNYYRREMTSGQFTRTVALPAEVDDAKAKAKFENGVLEVIMPKLETAKRRKVSVD